MKQVERNIMKRIVLGVILTLMAYFGLLAFLAFLLEQGRVGERHTSQCVALCACLASFAGVKTAARGMRKPLILTMVCIGAVCSITVLLGLLINDALDIRRTVEFAASMATGGGCAILLRIGKQGGGKHLQHTRR